MIFIEYMEEKLYQRGSNLYTALQNIYFFLAQLQIVYHKDSQIKLSEYILSDVNHIRNFLKYYKKEYVSKLPLPEEEPDKIDWMQTQCELAAYVTEFTVYYKKTDQNVSFLLLIDGLNDIIADFQEINDIFDAQDDENVFATYCINFLSNFYDVKTKTQIKHNLLPSIKSKAKNSKRESYCKEELQKYIQKLKTLTSPDIIDDVSYHLYYNVLGRQLWTIMHDSSKEKSLKQRVLSTIMHIEIYCDFLGEPLKFDDISPNCLTNAEKYRIQDEERKKKDKENLQNKINSFIKYRLDKYVIIPIQNSLDLCSECLVDKDWVKQFFVDALNDENVQQSLYYRLDKADSARNCICEFLFELSKSNLIKAEMSLYDIIKQYFIGIDVQPESIKRYARKGFEADLKKYFDDYEKRPVTQPSTE